MKHSKVLAFIIAFIALLSLSAEKVGDTVTKEVTIRAKTKRLNCRCQKSFSAAKMIYNLM